MITVLTGENSFEVQQALKALIAAFDGTTERIDGTSLESRDLPDLFMGVSLFAPRRLVIIRDLSQNGSVWEKLPDWLARVPDEIHIVLVEPKLDKRTTTYKAVKNAADLKEFPAWSDRDRPLAEAWVSQEAAKRGVSLDRNAARLLVARVGLDQWQLDHALEKLALLDEVTPATIEATIDPNPSENVFQLFELALDGRHADVQSALRTLELTEDPYKLFALLSSQAFQLAAVATAGEGANPAKELAIHPYVASKLSRHARQLGVKGSLRYLQAFAQADADMKQSRGEPWLLIEKALVTASH